jgi:hypothetical protein
VLVLIDGYVWHRYRLFIVWRALLPTAVTGCGFAYEPTSCGKMASIREL